MNLWKRIFNRNNGRLTDEDRAKAMELRHMQTKINYMEKQLMMKQHLDNLQSMITDSNVSDGEEKAFMAILAPLLPQLLGAGNKQPPTTPEGIPAQAVCSLAPEQMKAIASQIKKKIPEDVMFHLSKISDGDLLAIRQVMVNS